MIDHLFVNSMVVNLVKTASGSLRHTTNGVYLEKCWVKDEGRMLCGAVGVEDGCSL